jgi:predicted amidohydrolase YtcJ
MNTSFAKNYRSSHTGHSTGSDKADLVFINARVYTVNKHQPWVQAVAIKGGQFIAVGSQEDMQIHIGDGTQVVDLNGRFVMPGLYDMHTHPDLTLAPGYAGYLDVGVEDPTPEQVKQAILNYADEHPDTEWIFGQYFVHFQFKREGLEADRHWLDSIIADRAVAIHDRSWGCMLVNSKALELAGIDINTPDPGNGFIDRDSITDEPTGILVDGAYALIHAAMPPVPAQALERAYREGIQYQSARGVVGTKYVHVCEHRLNALKTIDDAGQMTLRVEAAISWQDDIFPVKRRWQLLAGERHFYRSARLNANAVKFHFDGTHGSRSAYLSTAWPGEEHWRGGLNLTPEHIIDMVVDMDRRGIRVIAHCVGDGASDLFLDAVAHARHRNGKHGVRHQCAHSTVLLDENLKRFAELNVVAEFSPVGWLPEPYARAREVMGDDRLHRMYNFKGVLVHGGIAVMGTDWPVSNINCWIGFEAMITRKNPWHDNDETFHGEGISVADAIQVMTLNGAACMDIDDKAGSIEVGKSADMIVLDRNLFEIEPQGNIHNTQVDITLMEGRVVWDRQELWKGTACEAVWQCDQVPEFYDRM